MDANNISKEKMANLYQLCLLICLQSVIAQRPPFAGSRPIGFPELFDRSTTEGLGNRFGDGTTERLPIEALGDRNLVERISKLPIDKQPFWYINWKALEEQRKNPQTFQPKPNVFIDNIPNTGTNFQGSANVAGNENIRQTNDNVSNQNNEQFLGNRNGGINTDTKSPQVISNKPIVSYMHSMKTKVPKEPVYNYGHKMDMDNFFGHNHKDGGNTDSNSSSEEIPNLDYML